VVAVPFPAIGADVKRQGWGDERDSGRIELLSKIIQDGYHAIGIESTLKGVADKNDPIIFAAAKMVINQEGFACR
jgi:hypothetical protein